MEKMFSRLGVSIGAIWSRMTEVPFALARARNQPEFSHV
jgi:hypothetical protein